MMSLNVIIRIIPFFLLGIIVLNFSMLTAWADFKHSEWPFSKNVSLPKAFDGMSYVVVFLDEDVYKDSLPDFSDIRVVDMADFKEVPYKMEIRRGTKIKKSFDVTLHDYHEISGQYTEFIADVGETSILHNELVIETYATNFRYDVFTEGSHDKKEWVPLGRDSIFDVTILDKDFKAQNTIVRYPPNTYRYIKSRVVSGDATVLKVVGLKLQYFEESLPEKRSLVPLIQSHLDDKENKVSEFVLDLKISGFPTNEIMFRVQDDNFYRKVQIEGSDDKRNWVEVNDSGFIYSYGDGDLQRKKSSIFFPETRNRYLRITILNEDDLPLIYGDMTLFAFEHQVVFEADAKVKYSIFYGNKSAIRPVYDLERTFGSMSVQTLPQANLGEQVDNLDYQPTIPVTERFQWFLPMCVGVAALIVALLVVKTYRKINKSAVSEK